MATKRRQSSRAKAPAAKPGRAAAKSKHYTRPGVEAAARLLSMQPMCDHVDKWEMASTYYNPMIKSKGGAKLVKLDKQREDWAAKLALAGDGEKCMTKDELLDVMIEWKFSKGKPRHALKPLLKSNSDASVVAATKGAFAVADEIPRNDTSGEYNQQISAAINQVCKLSGVGPATASAILCLYRPDAFAFMDDELIECLYDGKRGYTMKIFLEVNDRCREIASELNEAGEGEESPEWTPCKVGKALWAVATMSATNDEDGLAAIFEGGDAGIEGCRSNEENENSTNSQKRVKRG